MSSILNLSIDLSKVDKSKLVDGKYLNTQVFINDESKFGNNVSMAYSQSKEERESKVSKQYIANGRVVFTTGSISVAEKEVENVVNNNQKVEESDNLPF
jgi:hypothetical protein